MVNKEEVLKLTNALVWIFWQTDMDNPPEVSEWLVVEVNEDEPNELRFRVYDFDFDGHEDSECGVYTTLNEIKGIMLIRQFESEEAVTQWMDEFSNHYRR